MMEASSRPTRPKQMTPNEPIKRMSPVIRKSAAVMVVPKRKSTTRPRPMSVTAVMAVPRPPRLLTHRPTPRPRTFRITRRTRRTMDAASANQGLSAKARARDVNGDAHEIQENRGDVENIVGPIAPSGEKAVEVAEDLFGPEIDAALTRITVGQFDDGDALRPEKKQQGQEPKPDGNAAVGRDGRNHVEVDDRDDK